MYSSAPCNLELLDRRFRRLCRTALTVGCSAKAVDASSKVRYRSSAVVMGDSLLQSTRSDPEQLGVFTSLPIPIPHCEQGGPMEYQSSDIEPVEPASGTGSWARLLSWCFE